MSSLLRLCNYQYEANLPAIWGKNYLISKDCIRTATENACCSTANIVRLWALRIPHSVAVIVLTLSLYTKEPDGVGEAINCSMFLDLSSSTGSKATLLTRIWDAVLGNNRITLFANTMSLLGRQKVFPFTIWEAASKKLEAWTVLCAVLLGYSSCRPTTQEMEDLINEIKGVSSCLCPQYQRQSLLSTVLLYASNQSSVRASDRRWRGGR